MQRRLTHILTHIPRLQRRILFICRHSGIYCHLLLQGPSSPIVILFISPCSHCQSQILLDVFLFIFHAFTPLSLHVHYILFFNVIFVCLAAYQRPLFLIFCPAVSPSLISKCAAVYCAECRLCPRHQDLVPLSHPRCLFMLSVPACRVCLSASVLMDLSVVGLQHVQLANVTYNDLHLIRALR